MLNAWIPVATAIVSASAVLLGNLLTSRHSLRLKTLELKSASDLDRERRRREAGEGAYKALQMIAKLQSRSATIALDVLNGKIKLGDGTSQMAKIAEDISGIDALALRFKLEAYFPDVHKAWNDYEKLGENFLELAVLIKDNSKEISENYINKQKNNIDFSKFTKLPKEMRSTMHRVCGKIVDSIS